MVCRLKAGFLKSSIRIHCIALWRSWTALTTTIGHLKTLVLILTFSLTLKAQEVIPAQPSVQSPAIQNANPLTENSSRLQLNRLGNLDVVHAEINSFFSAYNFDEVQDRSQLVQLAIVPQIKIKLLKNLSFTGMGLIGLSTGRVQTRFDNPQFNSINLNELILGYSILDNLEIEAGALNQNRLNTPMLVQDRAFPGVQARNSFNIGKTFNVQLKAQYSIPNSVSFETDRTQNEALPSFLTQGFDFRWKPLEWLKLRGDVHHFTFNDLPSVVAFESGRLGNEVAGVQSSQSFFIYDFDGFSQSYDLSFQASKTFVPKIDIQMIYNSGAPTDRNRSQWTGVGFDWFFKDVIISPSVAYFFAESDSTPALYSDVRLGRNNREGMSYKLRVNFKNSGFSVSANYIQANLIETDPVQNDLRTFEFMLELPSVHF